jgi:hypothetical protein
MEPVSIALICLGVTQGITLLVAWYQRKRINRLLTNDRNYMAYQTANRPGDWAWFE